MNMINDTAVINFANNWPEIKQRISDKSLKYQALQFKTLKFYDFISMTYFLLFYFLYNKQNSNSSEYQ